MKVQWVWTEPICLYNCVLPQRKLSYGVFNQIELPQRELTIFWGRCDMSTKQPTSATGIHCHLAGCSWITYPKDQTKAILRKLEVANHWKMVASLNLCYYQRSQEKGERPSVGGRRRAGEEGQHPDRDSRASVLKYFWETRVLADYSLFVLVYLFIFTKLRLYWDGERFPPLLPHITLHEAENEVMKQLCLSKGHFQGANRDRGNHKIF